MSVVGVPMLLAPVLGPVLGGVLVTHLSWRWIFYVNLPIGLVGLVLAAGCCPRAAPRPPRGPGAAGLARPAHALPRRRARGLRPQRGVDPRVGDLRARPAGPRRAALVVAFALRAWRTPAPVVDVRLFEDRGFTAAAVTVFLVGAALFGSLLLPLYFQIARDLSPLQAGLLMAPQGLGAALGMNRAGRLTDRIGGGPVAVAGLFALMLGTIAFGAAAPGRWRPPLPTPIGGRWRSRPLALVPALVLAHAQRARAPRAPAPVPTIG
jgi:MFS family permease